MGLVALALPLMGAACGGEEEGSQESDLTAKPLGPEPSGNATYYPIILAHGFNASPSNLGFYRLADALRADGHVVYEAQVPPYDSVEARAAALAGYVEANHAADAKLADATELSSAERNRLTALPYKLMLPLLARRAAEGKGFG